MMNKLNNKLFAEDYWKQDGGRKWAHLIDATENYLAVFNESLLDRAKIGAGDVVLDIGCGGGINSIEIALRAGLEGRVLGVDISPDILAVAGERGREIPNLEFIEGDAATMDLDEGGYSLIFSRFGMMFFSDPVRAFNNLRRALRSGGRMVFLCWRTIEENPWMREPAQAVLNFLPPPGPPPDPDAPGPFSLGKKDRIEYLLNHAGFKSINIEALDARMSMGGLDELTDYYMQMGPAAAVIAEADDDEKKAARSIIRNVLESYATEEGVVMSAATWIVTAI